MSVELSFLKEGLKPQQKARITKVFNKAVNEKVKIELAALMEVKVNKIVKDVKTSITEQAKDIFKDVKVGTKGEIKKVSENLSKYIDFLIQESLPKSLVEATGKALKYADTFNKIEESIKDKLMKEARESIDAELEQLREEKRIVEEKHQKLFERMVSDASKQQIEKRRGAAKKLIEELPDKEAKVVSKIVESNIDFSAIEEKDIPKKIEEIHESVTKALNKNTKEQINENDEGKGRTQQTPPDDDDVIGLNEDVKWAENAMDKMTWNRGSV